MIAPELLKKIRRIQFKTSRMVTEIFSGEYRSVFKGRGMEFDAVREYQVGDDIRTIDWNVTARMKWPFVKEFQEERELTVIFIVDTSSSMNLGSGAQSKRERMAELCAVLAFTAIRNNDKVGVLLFSSDVEKYIPPAKGRRHVLRVIRELLTAGAGHEDSGSGTNMLAALEYFLRVQHRRTVCFVVSDFLVAGAFKALTHMARRHDLVALHLMDPLEQDLPRHGLVTLRDLETGRLMLLDAGYAPARAQYRETMDLRLRALQQQFANRRIAYLRIRTDEDYFRSLTRFFRERERRGR